MFHVYKNPTKQNSPAAAGGLLNTHSRRHARLILAETLKLLMETELVISRKQ